MLTLTVPTSPLVDEQFDIVVEGAEPGATVEVTTTTQPFAAVASATFRANDQGRLDVSTQAPMLGDYTGVDPMGLLWSARLPDGADYGSVLEHLESATTLTTTVSASDGQSTATALVARQACGPDVERIPLRNGQLRGTLFRPRQGADLPGVIVVGGS